MYFYTASETLNFQATVTDAHMGTLTYRWEVQLIHVNHIHTDQFDATTPTFSLMLAETGAASHGGERINYRVIFTVTNQYLLPMCSYLLIPKDTDFLLLTLSMPQHLIILLHLEEILLLFLVLLWEDILHSKLYNLSDLMQDQLMM